MKEKEKHAEHLNLVKRDIASNEKKWREMQSTFYSVLKVRQSDAHTEAYSSVSGMNIYIICLCV